METLGEQPVIVAQGRQMKNFVALDAFLRRNPSLAAIQTAIAETVGTGTALASITPKNKRVIRTEPVQMADGRMHGVHVWCGPTDEDPPERPIPGPLVWDLTLGIGTATTESLINAGKDPATESLTGRALIEDVPAQSLNPDESKALSWMVDAQPGRTYSATWDFTDDLGGWRRVGWCARTLMEKNEDGTEHLMCRAMNLVEEVSETPLTQDNLAHRILNGLAQPGVYRVLVNLEDWKLLKWIDAPCPYFNWRGQVQLHPEDREQFAERMRAELDMGTTSAVLRLPGDEGGWVPLHVDISKIELDGGIYGGLVTLRLPTDTELADAGLAGADLS